MVTEIAVQQADSAVDPSVVLTEATAVIMGNVVPKELFVVGMAVQ